MSLVVVVLLLALALGWARGGRLTRLADLPLRRRSLVVAAVLAQLAGGVLALPQAVGLIGSAGLVTLFLLLNREIRGTGLVALGLGLNALVVAANGAMPVSLRAADRAGADVSQVVAEVDARHELETQRTRLAVLGDVVPVALPVRPEVVSPGDVLLAAGLGQLVLLAMSGGPAPRTVPRRAVPGAARHARQGTRPPPAIPASLTREATRSRPYAR